MSVTKEATLNRLKFDMKAEISESSSVSVAMHSQPTSRKRGGPTASISAWALEARMDLTPP
jgi:hypothetical protein